MYLHLKFQSKYNLLDRVKGRQTGQVWAGPWCWWKTMVVMVAAGDNAECR